MNENIYFNLNYYQISFFSRTALHFSSNRFFHYTVH